MNLSELKYLNKILSERLVHGTSEQEDSQIVVLLSKIEGQIQRKILNPLDNFEEKLEERVNDRSRYDALNTLQEIRAFKWGAKWAYKEFKI